MRTKGATSLTKVKFVQLLALFNPEDEIVVGRKFLDSVRAANVKLRAKAEKVSVPTCPSPATIG